MAYLHKRLWEKAALNHQQNYLTFAKAVQPIIEDAGSGPCRKRSGAKGLPPSTDMGRELEAQAGGSGVSLPRP